MTYQLKRYLRLGTVLALALIAVPRLTPAAQPPSASAAQEEILKELRALRERVQQLEEDNRDLREAIGTPAPQAGSGQEAVAAPAAVPASKEAGAAAREETGITAGYDKSGVNGAYIRSPDGKFRLNIGAYTQARYNMNWRDAAPPGEEDFTRGFSINRTRLFFEGQYTDPLKYHLRINIDDAGDADLIAAYLQYNFAPGWGVRVGEQFMALSREDWMYAQDVLGLEFSPNDFTFAIGSSIGIQPQYQSDRYRFWFGASNGAFGGKERFPSVDVSDLTLSARYEYQLGGTDWGVWDDLVGRRGRSEGILLGLAAAYQIDRKDSGSSPENASEIVWDLSLNGDGYQAMISGTWLWVDPKGAESFSEYGLLAQGGYFLTDTVEVYGRYDWISPGDRPGDFDAFNDLAIGINYFPFSWTNRWKFSGELAYLFEALDRTIVAPSGSLGWLSASDPGQVSLRLQAQFGF